MKRKAYVDSSGETFGVKEHEFVLEGLGIVAVLPFSILHTSFLHKFWYSPYFGRTEAAFVYTILDIAGYTGGRVYDASKRE